MSENLDKYLQKEHEKAVGDFFISSYDKNFVFDKFGNGKDEPDLFYKKEKECIGVEVATAYYRDLDAKAEWDIARGKKLIAGCPVIKEPDEAICSCIQKEIEDKCCVDYAGAQRVIVVIEARAHLGDEQSAEQCLRKLVVPERCVVHEIYLLYSGSVNAIFQIFPKK